MRIILNNKEQVFDADQITIAELLKLKNFTFKMLVIKVNDRLVKKSEQDTTFVKDGYDVMVLHLISGG